MPRTPRMMFGNVNRLPRTIVQYERLVGGFGGLAALSEAAPCLLLGEAAELLGRRGLRRHEHIDPTIETWIRRHCALASRGTFAGTA